MDYEALANAKMHDYQRERTRQRLIARARQLNPRSPRSGIAARADRLLIRLGHAASKRQARRAAGHTGDGPMRNAYR